MLSEKRLAEADKLRRIRGRYLMDRGAQATGEVSMKTSSALLVAVVALVIPSVPGSQSIAQIAQQPSRILLQESSISKDITGLFVTEQSKSAADNDTVISVQILGRSIPQCEGRGVPGANNRCGQYLANPASFEGPKLKDMKIQVWVLRADGTMLQQKSNSFFSLCNAGDCTEYMLLVFEHATPNELAGVVMRVDGKLIVRDIQAK
jgi:hypothetical protein